MTSSAPGTAAKPKAISSGEVAFQAEARLLQELGERLVAAPEVAILELVKNARDADAEYCEVRLEADSRGHPRLAIVDTGSGMDQTDFLERWMRIATHSRRDPITPRFHRSVTGQKGIGRFAVRFLGNSLRLESVKLDAKTGKKTRLVALFNWRRLDRRMQLADAKVPYWIFPAASDAPTGTSLIVRRLRVDPKALDTRQFLTRLLRIVSPASSLNAGRFAVDLGGPRSGEGDPGFGVRLIGFESLAKPTVDVGDQVLGRAWARLTIDLKGQRLSYTLRFRGNRQPQSLRATYKTSIGSGLYADIAFFPRRRGMFEGMDVDGRQCWSWVRENSGVGVVDHGFRIKPYGFEDDDWLRLGIDHAHNEREWRSTVARAHFPLTDEERTRPGLSPALNLPTDFQLVGAVFVSSIRSGAGGEGDLIPSMDREGFLENQAFRDLQDVVRGGLEFLAKADKGRLLRAQEKEAQAALESLREDFREAVQFIRHDKTLGRDEKAALIKQYSHLATQVEEQEEYDRQARERLEVAAGLGVVAGYMTHEAERLFASLDDAIERLAPLARRDPKLGNTLKGIRESRGALDSYLSYTRLYIDSLRLSSAKPFKARPQIELVVQRFGSVAARRGIQTEVTAAADVLVPAVPVALYSAVLLNLYTNAVKAIIARSEEDGTPKVVIRAWNDERRHHFEVCDTGVGVPPQLRKRVWDPFFTTTSTQNSSFGSGMGLGLPLVKSLVARVKGSAEFVDPPPGFSTCVHVAIARNQGA